MECRILLLLQRMPKDQIDWAPMESQGFLCGCSSEKRRGKSALLLATSMRSLDSVRLLLEYMADPDTCNEEEDRPLTVATANNDIHIMAALLEHYADPNVKAPSGDYCPHIAGLCGVYICI